MLLYGPYGICVITSPPGQSRSGDRYVCILTHCVCSLPDGEEGDRD